jgi:2-oxoacid dehydrogenases acyltransferase (catalytic domain)
MNKSSVIWSYQTSGNYCQSKVRFFKFHVIKVKFKLLIILYRPEFRMPTVQWIVDCLLALRKKFKADGLSVNDFLIKAVGVALRFCPEVNVVWKGDEKSSRNVSEF